MMGRWRRRACGLALATGLLLGIAASASASAISIANRPISITWENFEVQDSAGFVWRCRVTITGSLHSGRIAKVATTLVGVVTSARSANCFNGNTITFLTATPWHLVYQVFSGSLPSFTSVQFGALRMALLVSKPNPMGYACLFASESARPAAFVFTRGMSSEIREVETRPTLQIPIAIDLSGLSGCPGEVIFRASAGAIVGLQTLTLA